MLIVRLQLHLPAGEAIISQYRERRHQLHQHLYVPVRELTEYGMVVFMLMMLSLGVLLRHLFQGLETRTKQGNDFPNITQLIMLWSC